MLIQDIQVIPLKLPVNTFGAGGFQGTDWDSLYIVLVRVESKEGLVGWGESFGYACWRPVVYSLKDMFIPLVKGHEVNDIAELTRNLQRQMHTYGRYGISMFALSGLDIALWDLKAKLANKSLNALLRSADAVNVPPPKLPAYASLFKYGDEELVRANCRRALDLGYGAIKLHENEEKEIKAARDEIGAAIPLATDVNCCWTAEEAGRAAIRLKTHELMWLEEPIFPPEDYKSLSALRKYMPIAAGENACTFYEFEKMISCQAVDFAQPSVTKVGGITEFVKIMRLLEGHKQVRLAPHSAYFGPGLLATMHLIAAMPYTPMIERFLIEPEADMFNGLISPTNGFYQLNDSPGLGADPNEDIVQEYRIIE